MNLSFLHAELALLGVAAAVAPIVVHLLFKTKPKPIVFPALQLIRKRKTSTVKRLRLQHLLLLAVRIGLLSMLGCALARPTLHSSLFSIDQKAPVAVALVFDTSPSMGYVRKGKSRLDEAKELAQGMLGKLPDNSEVTLIESANPMSAAPIDVAAAIGRLKIVAVQASARHLNQAVVVACRGLAKSQKTRREIYVFSDLAQSAWNLGDAARDEFDRAAQLVGAQLKIYGIDVGAENPENVALGDVQLAQQTLPSNSDSSLTVQATCVGPAARRTAALVIDGEARDSVPITLQPGQTHELKFKLPPLAEGLHTGHIALNHADPLEFDDIRYFTVEARRPIKALLVADEGLDAVNFANAIAPERLRKEKRAAFEVYGVTAAELGDVELEDYGLVALLNVGQMPPIAWQRLGNFVNKGGGLFVALAERSDRNSCNSPEAQAVLPVRLDRDIKPDASVQCQPEVFSHPVLAKFQSFEQNDMAVRQVFRYWKFEPMGKGASPLMHFSNRAPALVEKTSADGARGRVLVLASAAHYRPPPYAAWNELPLGWSYVVLMDQIARYLTGMAETRHNYFVGGMANVAIDPALGHSIYSLTSPAKVVERTAVGPKDLALSLPVKEMGHYRVDAGDAKKPFGAVFSVNVPAVESALAPVAAEKLKEVLGKERVALARDPSQLEAAVDEGRVGKELFAWLMFAIVAVVCLEGYFANRFYRKPDIAPQLAVG